MSGKLSHRLLQTGGGLFVIAMAVILVVIATSGSRGSQADPPAPATLSVAAAPTGAQIQAGFIGFSMEFYAVQPYTGNDPNQINPLLVQLIKRVSPGGPPVLRIGGDSSDRSYVPTPGAKLPKGLNFPLTRQWFELTKGLAKATRAQLIMGVNVEAGSEPLAAAEARAFVDRLGPAVSSLELGNEPELWGTFTYWRGEKGRKHTSRPKGYDIPQFDADFEHYAAKLPKVPLAGPTTGAPQWLSRMQEFLGKIKVPVSLVTVHRYPLKRCYAPAASPQRATLAHLLQPSSSAGLADTVSPTISLAAQRRLPVRVDELNSVACQGKWGLSNTFASALWMLDTLFQLARVGVVGVNVHTLPGAAYQPFSFRRVKGQWRVSVKPEYYALLLFTQAAPPGSRLLSVTGADGDNLRAYATRGQGGATRIVLINDNLTAARQASVRVAGVSGPATVSRLLAPGPLATKGITLGGRSFGKESSVGRMSGPKRLTRLTAGGDGSYRLSLPPASVALLTIREPAPVG